MSNLAKIQNKFLASAWWRDPSHRVVKVSGWEVFRWPDLAKFGIQERLFKNNLFIENAT